MNAPLDGVTPSAGENDTTVYSGDSAQYSVVRNSNGSYTVTDSVSGRA